MKKLAIVITHPIQYYAPVFKRLTERERLQIKVFYTWGKLQYPRYDPGFGRAIQWDIPLLEGYDYTFVRNNSFFPGSNCFWGTVNFSLHREIEDWRPEALLVVGWSFYSHLAAMLYFKNKIPILFRGDSTLLTEKPGLKQLLRDIYLPWVYRHVDRALYVGKNNKDYFLKYGLKDEQLFFVPHAIDTMRFQDAIEENKKKAMIWRRSLGIADDKIVFLFAGKLEPRKGPFLLLEAFKQLNDTKAHLIFVGSGKLEEELKRQASARVHFIDFQNQSLMPVVYHLGDIFILPSQRNEPWGLVVNEAMACGLPVLVSDKCGCAVDLVVEGKNGYIFPSRNKDELCIKIQRMLDKNKLKSMGAASRDLIQGWSIDALCSGIEESIIALS